MSAREGETYLGDGLYASFDGWQIKLRAPQMDGTDQLVFLEAHVYAELIKFVARIPKGETYEH